MPFSLYLHIPFCTHRCAYCDFNTYAGLEELVPAYVEALCAEIAYVASRRSAGRSASRPVTGLQESGERLPVHTIFFGGGTPSLLPLPAIEQILATAEDAFALVDGLEVTLEANPGTLDLAYLRGLHSLGVNRLSLGMQSANPEELRFLERQHGYREVVQAVTWARQAGFANFNLDLIFGLPGQSRDSWRRSLELALGLQPQHFSLYALSIEHGTPLQAWLRRGLVDEPDPDLAAEMYEQAAETLERAGYEQYEISNWARREAASGELLACRHNLQYWRMGPYLGLGAGAHGYAGGVRTATVLSPQVYIQRMGVRGADQRPFPRTPATASANQLSQQEEMGETMIMGLRLVHEGVAASAFARRFGPPLEAVFGEEISSLERVGLLEWVLVGNGERILRLTPRGRLLGNQVFMRFI